MTKYVGIDQSFRNFAVWVHDSETGADTFKVFRTERTDNTVFTTIEASEKLIWDVSSWLIDDLKVFKEDFRVAFEQLAFGGQGNAAKDLAMLLAVCISTLKNGELRHLPYLAPIGQVKKLATGRGNKVSKKEMFAALPTNIQYAIVGAGYKVATGSEDLADAYFISKWIQQLSIQDKI